MPAVRGAAPWVPLWSLSEGVSRHPPLQGRCCSLSSSLFLPASLRRALHALKSAHRRAQCAAASTLEGAPPSDFPVAPGGPLAPFRSLAPLPVAGFSPPHTHTHTVRGRERSPRHGTLLTSAQKSSLQPFPRPLCWARRDAAARGGWHSWQAPFPECSPLRGPVRHPVWGPRGRETPRIQKGRPHPSVCLEPGLPRPVRGQSWCGPRL